MHPSAVSAHRGLHCVCTSDRPTHRRINKDSSLVFGSTVLPAHIRRFHCAHVRYLAQTKWDVKEEASQAYRHPA